MKIERHLLYPDNPDIYYTCYLQEASPELPASRKRPGVVICPGGGYLVTSDREAEPVALAFLQKGYQAFVLRYATEDRGDASFPGPLTELARVMATLRSRAEAWQLDTERIAVAGFSAGGNLCGMLAAMWHHPFLSQAVGVPATDIRPDAVILGYPLLDYPYQTDMTRKDPARMDINGWGVSKMDFMKRAYRAFFGEDSSPERQAALSPITHVSGQTPPVFLWTTAEDAMVYPGHSLRFAQKLMEHGVPCELHLFEKGEHGLSMATAESAGSPSQINDDVALWSTMAFRFLERQWRKHSV